MIRRGWSFPLWVSLAVLLVLQPSFAAQEPKPEQAPSTGWICGLVMDESGGFAGDTRITVHPQDAELGSAPVAEITTDARGGFCLKDLRSGFYDLRPTNKDWPMQAPVRAEVRAGLVNRLRPIELELEPGEPHVRFAESFDGMRTSQARGLLEQLLDEGSKDSVIEICRRFLPKRGISFDLNPVITGFDIKPVFDELVRQLEGAALPPLKTARYVYLIGEFTDARTETAAMDVLLRKLRDGRSIPSRFAPSERPTRVSDIAIQAVFRIAGRDFKWKYGAQPTENMGAIRGAQVWWQSELEKRGRDRRQ